MSRKRSSQRGPSLAVERLETRFCPSLVNGSFEVPSLGDDGFEYLTISPGAEPEGFGWAVVMGNVDVVHAGLASWGVNYTAVDGEQLFDLNGTTPGAIAQEFPTTAGNTYILEFAYANNASESSTDLARAYVAAWDTETGGELFALEIEHGTATRDDPNWDYSGPVMFTAQGASTILVFWSLDSEPTRGGILLDAVAVSEAGSFPGRFTPSADSGLVPGLAGIRSAAERPATGMQPAAVAPLSLPMWPVSVLGPERGVPPDSALGQSAWRNDQCARDQVFAAGGDAIDAIGDMPDCFRDTLVE